MKPTKLEQLEAEVKVRKQLWLKSYNDMKVTPEELERISDSITRAEEKLHLFKVAADTIANPPKPLPPINPFQSVPLEDRKLLVMALEQAHDIAVDLAGDEDGSAYGQSLDEEAGKIWVILRQIKNTYTGNLAQAKEDEDENHS